MQDSIAPATVAAADAQPPDLDPKLTVPTEPLPPVPRRPRPSKNRRLRDADLDTQPDSASLQTQAQMTIAGMLPFPEQSQSGSPGASIVVDRGIPTSPDALRGSSSSRGRSILRTTRRSSRKSRDAATVRSDATDGVTTKAESSFSLSPDRARDEEFTCVPCAAKVLLNFTRAEHLARHIKCTHEGIKEFQCPICFKMYGRQDERLRHLRMHAKRGETAPSVDGNSVVTDQSVEALGSDLNSFALSPDHVKESDSQIFSSSKYTIPTEHSSPTAGPESNNNPRSSWTSSLGSISVVNLSDASHRSSTITFSNTLVSPSASAESSHPTYPNIGLKNEDTFSTSSTDPSTANDSGGPSSALSGFPLKIGMLPSNLSAARSPSTSIRSVNNSKSAQFLKMQYMHNQRNLYLLQQQRLQQFQGEQSTQVSQPVTKVGASDDINMSLWQHQQLQPEEIEILSLQREQLLQMQSTQLQRDPSSHIPYVHVHQPQDYPSTVPFTLHDQIQQSGAFIKRSLSLGRSPKRTSPTQIGYLGRLVGIEAMMKNDNTVSTAAAEAFPFGFDDK
ncbi:hypothetical protein HDU83_005092 [Entophlyctis luteolus]|nr:hypothetical protein HDU83_005092 [Entophlyctis luteolus]